jgi:hypothetical protein
VVEALCSTVILYIVLCAFDAQCGASAKCHDKRFCLCAFDLVLEGKEGGSSA